jgi:hypothetical protein
MPNPEDAFTIYDRAWYSKAQGGKMLLTALEVA